MTYVWIAVGGALGSIARHWCTGVATALFGAAFPWGTLFINILGSFVIGLFFALTGPGGRFDVPLDAKLFVMTGICGGYTTFSTFSLETLRLMQDRQYGSAALNAVGSVLLCLLGVWLGHTLAATWNPR
jgi:CrcB protein